MFLAVMPDDPMLLGQLYKALTGAAPGPVQLRCIENLSMALARIAGGGVDGIVFDVSLRTPGAADPLEPLRHLLAEARGVPVFVLSTPADEALAAEAVAAGAAGYAVRSGTGDLKVAVAAGSSHAPRDPSPALPLPSLSNQRKIALFGAKGGVGATTLALNLAASLAGSRPVILVEMRSSLGTLGAYFSSGKAIRTLTDLAKTSQVTAFAAKTCLWKCPEVPNLKILFASQAHEIHEIAPAEAVVIYEALSELAGCIVVDLPPGLSILNRSIIERSDLAALVVERDALCVAVAGQIMTAVRSWNSAPEIGAIVVNRTPLVAPVPIASIETALGLHVLGTIPPAPDACVRAQNQREPLVALDPESLVAQSVIALARRVLPEPPEDPLKPPPFNGRSSWEVAKTPAALRRIHI